eukprot:TRINITY_DN12882_c0_g1_i11.p1 TRINITY_DN12882_c0_g1~~TRINITY_DN12882_c0_g1_i11.p1  ORF type:complete len:153 (-),score=3.85 TRINITY_DN12882_c0_g1_i11:317-775(-)
MLFRTGFGLVWLNQGVENINAFLFEFRQRLIDCRWQSWNEHIQDSDRFALYRTFKSTWKCEHYLLIDIDRHIKSYLTRFGFGVTDMVVHQDRYNNVVDTKLTCPQHKMQKKTKYIFYFVVLPYTTSGKYFLFLKILCKSMFLSCELINGKSK